MLLVLWSPFLIWILTFVFRVTDILECSETSRLLNWRLFWLLFLYLRGLFRYIFLLLPSFIIIIWLSLMDLFLWTLFTYKDMNFFFLT